MDKEVERAAQDGTQPAQPAAGTQRRGVATWVWIALAVLVVAGIVLAAL